MSDTILEIRHLSKTFGTHAVLKDVDFTVSRGDVTSIIGASGSGKSTLLRCINLLETLTTGEILFHGESVTGGKINQSGWGLNKIRFHLVQKGIAKETIDEALGQTDEEVYCQRLMDILKTKSKTVKAENDFEKKRKLAAYAMQKGFEAGLVWEVLKEFQVTQNENR